MFRNVFAGAVLVAALAFTLGADPAPAKANNDPAYAALRTAALGGETAPVQNLILTRDIATITFKNGTLHFLAPVEGRVVGAVFIGEGEFRIAPVLEVEQRQLRILSGGPTLTDTFSGMVLRFTDGTYDELKGKLTLQSGTPDSRAQDLWESNRKLFRKGRIYSDSNVGGGFVKYNVDLRLLVDLAWPGQGGFFQACFDGKEYGDLLFAVDPLGAPFVTPEEVVLAALGNSNLGIWVSEHIRAHYAAGNAADEDHTLVDMDHFTITATAKGQHLEATAQARFHARVDGARVLPLTLFPKLRMKKVTDGGDRELSFIQEDKDEDADFAVILPEGMAKGNEYILNFSYAGDEAVIDQGGGNFTLVARESWYPNVGFGDRATFDLTLKAPKELTMVATGQPAGESAEGDLTVSRWKTDVPIGVAGFNYGAFKKSVVNDEKIKTVIESYANKKLPDSIQGMIREIEEYERQSRQSTGTTLGALNTVQLMDKSRAEAQMALNIYSDMFGPLPYGRVAMTQQPFASFGQSWPMLVYMPLTAFFDTTYRQQLGLGGPADKFFKYVGAHEVSHQWWGHVVGWKSYRDQWLSEGFAEFSTSLFVQVVYKNDKFVEFWKDAHRQMMEKNRQGKVPEEVGGPGLGYRLDTARTGWVTPYVVYSKGAFVLHMLRMLMRDNKTGDARFEEMMKDFTRTYFNRNASSVDFQRIVEKHMTPMMDMAGDGKMDWFFREWVDGTTIPEYRLTCRVEAADGGKWRLVGSVAQSGVEDSFMMRVPVYMEFGGGKIVRLGSLGVAGNSSSPEFNVRLPEKPKRVFLCAYEDVLCTIKEN